MEQIPNVLTWGGASALALLITQVVKYLLPTESRLAPLVSMACGMAVLLAYAWLKGTRTADALVDIALLGLFAGAAATGFFEAQKLLPLHLPSRTPKQ